LVFGLIAWAVGSGFLKLALLLPGLIALPLYALLPNLGGRAVPLSLPVEESKSAGRGLTMVGVMLLSGALAGVAAWAWSGGWFWWLLLGELLVVIGLYLGLRSVISAARWPSLE